MKYELAPKERVTITSKRLIALRGGAGDYSPEQREIEIGKTEKALQAAFADQRRFSK